MMARTFLAGSLFMLLGSGIALANDTGLSPYAGSETREIKALSFDEIASYLQGKGMGLAKEQKLERSLEPSAFCENKSGKSICGRISRKRKYWMPGRFGSTT